MSLSRPPQSDAMIRRLAAVPVVFMPVPRPPARIRRLRRLRLRAWACIAVGLTLFWYGLFAWALS